MLQALFGFRGRLSRLQFMGWAAVWFCGFIVLAIAITLAGAAFLSQPGMSATAMRLLSLFGAALLALVAVWSWLAILASATWA